MIAIIDYGMGNLRSVQKAFEFLGFPAVITDSREVIARADHVVLPGVGAFRDAMACLRETGLDQAVLEAARVGKPVLGICLGMQMMFQRSEENGVWEAATCDYGQTFTAVVCRGNVMATQFHPEKSGEAGLKILRRFAQWKGAASC